MDRTPHAAGEAPRRDDLQSIFCTMAFKRPGAGYPLPAVAPFDAGLALFLADRNELVLEQRIRERIIGPDMKRSRFFSLKGREQYEFSALHQVDGFKTPH